MGRKSLILLLAPLEWARQRVKGPDHETLLLMPLLVMIILGHFGTPPHSGGGGGSCNSLSRLSRVEFVLVFVFVLRLPTR